MRYLVSLLVAGALVSAVSAAEPRTLQEATVFARNHCRNLPLQVASDTRYLWLPRQNAQGRKAWWQVVSGWTHAQSREAGIFPPAVVIDTERGSVEVSPFALKDNPGPGEFGWHQAVLVSVRLSYYRFSPKVWERFAIQHPFMHRTHYWTGGYEPTFSAQPWMSDTKEQYDAVLELQKLTGAVVGLMRADNWYWQTAIVEGREVGYHGLLEIKNQADYEKVIGFDPNAKVDKAFLQEVLAAVSGEYSGVTEANRRVERLEKIKGAYWRTKDNDRKDVARDDRRNPLVTPDRTLKFKAIEAFGHNACGFWVTGLFDDVGKSQNSAPDFIGYNHHTKRNDGRIHNGYVCFHCHDDGGLKDIRCHFRELAEGKDGLYLQTTNIGKLPELLQYLPPLDPYLKADRERYAAALWQATGLTPPQFAALLHEKYFEYEGGVDLNRAAAELGTTPQELLDRFEKYRLKTNALDTVLANLTRGKKVFIEDWHRRYNLAALTLRGLSEWPKKH